MSIKLKSGTGTPYEAGVNSENRLLTQAESRSSQLQSAIRGEAYQIGAGPMVLTSANESAALFIKNEESKDLIITDVSISSGAMTGSSANVFLIKVYTDATGIVGGSAGTAVNNNFNANRDLTGTVTVGAEAATVTNGTLAGAFYCQNNTFFTKGAAWVLPKGASVTLTVTPGASNTSMPVAIALESNLVNK